MNTRNALMASSLIIGLHSSVATADNPSDNTELQAIVVSANRQGDRSVQTVPMSISVINPETMDKLGATGLSDLAPSVPSLSIEQSGPGLNKIDMRGISTGAADIVNNLEDRPLGARPGNGKLAGPEGAIER